jgi:phosphate starvation-inducible membrane PsiE
MKAILARPEPMIRLQEDDSGVTEIHKPEEGDPIAPTKFYATIEHAGHRLVDWFHLVALFVVGAMIIWATGIEILLIFREAGPSVKDILLLFIYLELGAMVGIYFKTRKLPVRFLLYIAITALTRVLAIDIKEMPDERIIAISLSILLLTVSVLLVLFSTARFAEHE